ncbi:hypothetical protein SAMN04515668_4417 [Hymenobacter arizonensis]|uniref:Uncharacterized protein n=1 Tax=Hymenobacter arizonensis TaxID=1227077 RepID=A0A1I6BE64_HYMAR|nr:hypothetical protein SAMN04515668_4417 [Hymenobacter arizonensis]
MLAKEVPQSSAVNNKHFFMSYARRIACAAEYLSYKGLHDQAAGEQRPVIAAA